MTSGLPNVEAPEVRRAPPEFGEDQCQFILERSPYPQVQAVLPAVLWVTPEPNEDFPCRICATVYKVSLVSGHWLAKQANPKYVTHPGRLWVCGHQGRLVE